MGEVRLVEVVRADENPQGHLYNELPDDDSEPEFERGFPVLKNEHEGAEDLVDVASLENVDSQDPPDD